MKGARKRAYGLAEGRKIEGSSNSLCKGPQVISSRNSEEASVAGAEWSMGKGLEVRRQEIGADCAG